MMAEIANKETSFSIADEFLTEYKNKAKNFIALAGANNMGGQINQVLTNASKIISKWPERWYSAQQAIDFISRYISRKNPGIIEQ